MTAVGFCVDDCGLCSSPTVATRHSYSSGWVGYLGHSGTDEERSRTIVRWKRCFSQQRGNGSVGKETGTKSLWTTLQLCLISIPASTPLRGRRSCTLHLSRRLPGNMPSLTLLSHPPSIERSGTDIRPGTNFPARCAHREE